MFIIPKDFSSIADEKQREKSETELVQKTISNSYKEGYYCIACVVKPDKEDTFDVNAVRNNFTVSLYKKQTNLNPTTGGGNLAGTSITQEKTLNNQSVASFMDEQAQKVAEG